MNKQFVVKMMQAKKLQYEAFKEIMPEPMANRIIKLENEIFEIGKEYFMSGVYEASKNQQNESSETKAKTRKVTIE